MTFIGSAIQASIVTFLFVIISKSRWIISSLAPNALAVEQQQLSMMTNGIGLLALFIFFLSLTRGKTIAPSFDGMVYGAAAGFQLGEMLPSL